MTCSWCKVEYVPVEPPKVEHSHGMCPACKDRLLATEILAARELRAYERERDKQETSICRDERTLSTLYGVPLHLSSVF